MSKLRLFLLIGTLLVITAVTAAADTLYTVQQGDTLAAIARRFNSNIQTLIQRNNIANPNLIYSGQQIIIPDANSNSAPPPSVPPSQDTQQYTVQPGDTLAAISRRFNVSVLAIVQANNITNPNLIFVGRVLTIPGTNAQAPAENPPPPSNDPAPPSNDPAPPPVASGSNLLANGSFEAGWYHPNGIPELQVPEHWQLEWDEGATGFGLEPWDIFVRPETRVLPANFLPPHEHSLFIWDGEQTVKIFKGRGPVSFRLLTNVQLAPGTYQFAISLFPDLVKEVQGGQKVWADNGAGEMQFIVNGQRQGWQTTTVGQRNTITHTFSINQAQTVSLGIGVRGKYAILNNGWFMDDWRLQKVQ
ncbi:MAG: LysM peptidoglycan-binding domain-containing protein [Chloroflexota bacterium]